MKPEPVTATNNERPTEGHYVAFGFGHPAHKPDPDAKYGFEGHDRRVMPVRPEKRWRVTG